MTKDSTLVCILAAMLLCIGTTECNLDTNHPIECNRLTSGARGGCIDLGIMVPLATESNLLKVGSKYRMWVGRESHSKMSLYEADTISGPYSLIGNLTVNGNVEKGAFQDVKLIGNDYYITYSKWSGGTMNIYTGILDATGTQITLTNSGNPILAPDTGIAWEASGHLANPVLSYKDGTWYLLYESWGTGENDLNQIGLASGASLGSLTRSASNPAIPGNWSPGWVGNPFVIDCGNSFFVAYGQWTDDYALDSDIVGAYTDDFITYEELDAPLRIGANGHNQCDPSLLFDGKYLYMTYFDNSPEGVYVCRFG